MRSIWRPDLALETITLTCLWSVSLREAILPAVRMKNLGVKSSVPK